MQCALLVATYCSKEYTQNNQKRHLLAYSAFRFQKNQLGFKIVLSCKRLMSGT